MEQVIIDKLSLTVSDKSIGASFLNNEIIWHSQSLDVYVMECDETGFKHLKGLITIFRSPSKGIAPMLVSPVFLKESPVSEIQDMIKEDLFPSTTPQNP